MIMTKQELRSEIRKKRTECSEQDIVIRSIEICIKLMESRQYIEASVVLAYVPIKGEVDVKPVIKAALEAGKTVAVPKVTGKTMSFYEIKQFEDLQPGYMGIPEPKEYCPLVECGDALMIMPGTAFDVYLHRCGYGGGFYDRYLEHRPGIKKLAVAFDFQIYEKIPCGKNDIEPDMILTETRVFCSPA